MNVNAQPQWGQMPSTNPTFKDINYAGDGLEAHNLDIYLPENQQSPSKVVVIIYGSAWFANNMKAMAFMSIGKPLLDAGFARVECTNPPDLPLEEAMRKEVAQQNISQLIITL